MTPTKEQLYAAQAAKHGGDVQAAFAAATVAVCGLGGLGSNVAVMLARSGIGKLILIDFDRVDITNLHRQQYKADQVGQSKAEALTANLREIAPYVTLESHTERITESNIRRLLDGADVIVEAFDNAEAKAMLFDGVTENFPEKYLVTASGMAGMDSANNIKTRRLTDKIYLCGDGVSDIADGNGLYSARVALCAAHEALAVMRILAGKFDV